jgi:outer membrane protein
VNDTPQSSTTWTERTKARRLAGVRSLCWASRFLVVALAACSAGEHSAAWDPYAAAPQSFAEPWTPPAPLAGYMPAALAPEPAAALGDPDKVHDLVDLIDVAQRNHPETRRAWAEARARAAGLGIAESAYFPTVALAAQTGYSQAVRATREGTEIVRGVTFDPGVKLAWLLLDFGRRDAERDRAQQEVLRSNFAFNRKHQEVAFAVERAYYGLDASRAQAAAARSSLKAADAVLEAAQARYAQGLAAETDVLLARQEEARAAFELAASQGAIEDAHAALAESIGVPATLRLRVVELSAEPLPPELPATVELVIDRALEHRPDLAAQLAALRAREAELRRARADLLPKISAAAAGGGAIHGYRAGPPFGSFHDDDPFYSATLGFEWSLFEGFALKNAVRQAESERDVAQADLAGLELHALREVWQAYAAVKTALSKNEFAAALVKASEDAYASALASYRAGVGTLLDLLASERDLARARSTAIASRAELLTAAANLALAAGDASLALPASGP